MKAILLLIATSTCFIFSSCETDDQDSKEEFVSEWKRDVDNPVFRDLIPSENYQAASDPHVFYDDNGSLYMIYTGDNDGVASIKLAKGTSLNQWEVQTALLFDVGPSGQDISKETAFYRKSSTGKHQIYYIGYEDENSYQSQIFLAEADELTGPYTQLAQPVVPRGSLAGKDVYLITSPSVVEDEDKLHICFLGWDDSPEEVTEVWVMGATSSDDGHTWSDYQLVDTRIGMEGQVTKINENEFVAVRSGVFGDQEAIYYATASHPFGPWEELNDPIMIQNDPTLEKDEIIAPQITIDPVTGEEYLYYTGADYQTGWWVMLATKE